MPVVLINANAATQGPWRALDWIGFVIFATGFTIETIADRQKRSFKADAKNKGRYIDSGLWSISRHPKTFGIYWFVQGVWVLVTTMPVVLINANAATQGPWRALDWIGFVIFATGF